MIDHREKTRTQIPAALIRNSELAQIMGLEAGTGLVVVAGRGKGVRSTFPESRLKWEAKELQEWMMGVMGPRTKFRNVEEL